MRKTIWIAAGLALALVACGKSGEQNGGNQSAAAKGPGGSAPAVQMKLNPGLWETNVEMAVSGLPANVAAMMKGTKVTTRSCVTQEEASRPSGEIFAGKQRDGCTYSDYSVSGGRIHGKMSCTGNNGQGAMTMVMDGKYGGDSFDVTMNVDTKAAGQSMAIGSHTTGRRIGACSAADKEASK
jgi:hypothetical protein